jgi:molybdate transport system ATP-binding protein
LQDEIALLRETVNVPLVLVTHDFEDVVRLATHVLLLERGCTVALGHVSALMSRPDLSWLREAVGLGAVFHAVVTRADSNGGLAQLDFAGGTLLAAAPEAAVGAIVRVRIPAREVILATRQPEGLSLHNSVYGRVSAIHIDPAFAHVIVQIAIGDLQILAEVTRDAIEKLGLTVGGHVHALIKSVSIDVRTLPKSLGNG